MSPRYEPFILALVFVVFGILVKSLSRRDGDILFKRNDFAVSTSVSLMTLAKIWTDLFAAQTLSHELFFEALIGCLAPFTFAALDRHVSWIETPEGPKKRIWLGIVIPNIIAVVILFIYYQLRFGKRSL